MHLPNEIWKNILENTSNIKDCQKLFDSFNHSLQEDLKNTFEYQINKLSETLAISIDRYIFIYTTNKLDKILKNYCPIYSLRFRPNTDELYVGGTDCNIYVWDYKNSKIIKTISGATFTIRKLYFSPNGQYIAAIESMKNNIKVWDLLDDKMYEVNLVCPSDNPTEYLILYNDLSIDFHPTDNKILISGAWLRDFYEYHLMRIQTCFWEFDSNNITDYSNLINRRPIHFSIDGKEIDYVKSKEGIYSGDKILFEEKSQIMEFIRIDNKIFYITVYFDYSYINMYDLDKKQKTQLDVINCDSFSHLQVSGDCKRLIYHNPQVGIIIYSLEGMDIIERIFEEELKSQENIEICYFFYKSKISDFHYKNCSLKYL